jgi:16S rRNA processing protein RimM
MNSDELIEVAKLGKAVGLKGFLKLHDLSDFPDQFKKNSKFFIDENKTLEISDFDKTRNIVRFVGINDRDEAFKLTNKILKTTKEDTLKNCKLKKGEFFWFDIIGCKVIENDETLGMVEDIERIGTQDYLSVKSGDDFVKNGFQKSFLIPYIDKYIAQTDVDSRQIITLNAKDLLVKIE